MVIQPAPAPTVPEEVVLTQTDIRTPRFTPRELDIVKEHLGRSFTQVIADEDTNDKWAVIAWLKLRRNGYALEWEEMRDVVISVLPEVAPDPTSEQPQTISPPSAATGE